MTQKNADPAVTTNSSDRPLPTSIQRLAEAVARLNNDAEWFVDALTEYLLTMAPISGDRLTEAQRQYLVESGAFTSESLAATSREVDRGSLQLSTAQVWLSQLSATMSLGDAADFLEWEPGEVQKATSERRLHAVELSGRLRFPTWQFRVGSPEKLLPGLSDLLRTFGSGWHWNSVAAFMNTPQPRLVATGRRSPVEWLRNGGDSEAVTEVIEADRWM